ncbi:hypothetical protein SUGI_1199390 [Cryptomeria japonica]|nr:hypothetical protein SUGI_1199390 [Cryptomeria japonica]
MEAKFTASSLKGQKGTSRKETNQIDESDEDLKRRAKAAEDQILSLSQELELINSTKKSELKAELLLQKLREQYEEKRKLLLVIRSEIRSRLKERSRTNEALRLIEATMDNNLRKIENEKKYVQVSLEMEVHRQSSERAEMLSKFRAEKTRMKETIADLGEQNVALNRRVSSLNNIETDQINLAKAFQERVDDLETKLVDAQMEIMQLKESLSESQNKLEYIEHDRNSIQASYKEKEMQNSQLQKSAMRWQRLCMDQEKALGEEQVLRQDLEICQLEAEALRHEKACLLKRLQRMEEDQHNWFQLNEEKADALQGLPLLDEENVELSS